MRGKPQRFNEAAGFTQRKLCEAVYDRLFELRFNEAAGFTRRKPRERSVAPRTAGAASMRPPDLPGGNYSVRNLMKMRPPDLPGGNGIGIGASMRPPDLPGGNRTGQRRNASRN